MSRDALELASWRFIATHRAGGLAASHAQFIDSGTECRINTPSHDRFYESVGAPTFGEAAIKLAIALGMPWPTQCREVLAVCGDGSSSAPTAIRLNGESVEISLRIQAETVGSTTGATSAEADIGESDTSAERREPHAPNH